MEFGMIARNFKKFTRFCGITVRNWNNALVDLGKNMDSHPRTLP